MTTENPSSQHESDLKAAREWISYGEIAHIGQSTDLEAFLAGCRHARAEERKRAEGLVGAFTELHQQLCDGGLLSCRQQECSSKCERLRKLIAAYKREGGG